MSPELLFGLRLSAIGLGVTFVALGLLSLMMRGLLRVFPPEKAAPKPSVEAPAAADDEERRLEEMAVALAVGISLLEREGSFVQRDPTLGKLLEEK